MLVMPVAAGLFTAIFKKAGFEVALFDATLYSGQTTASASPSKRVEYLQARKFSYEQDLGFKLKTNLIEDFVAKVDSFEPDLMVITLLEDAFLQALALLESVREKNIPNISGGVFVTAVPEKVISHPQIKMIGLGEGEKTLLEVAERLRDALPVDNIPNVWIKKNDGRIIKNPIGPLEDINEILPDYSLFEEVRFYRPMGGKILRTIPLETSRGCPFACTFCNSPMWNGFYQGKCGTVFFRRKKIARLIEEIKYLVKEYKPDLFYVVDDTFLARPSEELREFAEQYKQIRVPFWMNTRLETITQENMTLLQAMNCYRLSVGVECGNEEFRRNKLNRHISNQEILERMEILSKNATPFTVNNIIGFPDETRELIFETIELNRKLSGYDTLTVSIFVPYQGTKLRAEAVKRGYLDADTITTHTTASSLLQMPHLTSQEIDGLMRTFTMYVGFPKKWWPYLKEAERFTPEGDEIFAKLSKIYSDVYLSGDQYNKPKEITDWDVLEKQYLKFSEQKQG